MLKNIVVCCSPLTGTLRIGRVNKNKTYLLEWEEREYEILEAVRDFLFNKAIKSGYDDVGYEWTIKDGRKVRLTLQIIEDGNNK